jgi:hypothetical protein
MTYYTFTDGAATWYAGFRKEASMPRRSPFQIVLTEAERTELDAVARKYTSPYYLVMRAKVVLFAAEDMGNKEIGQRLDLPRQVVSKWRKRFFTERLAGLEDRPRRGRPPVFPPRGRRGGQGRGL